MRVLVVEDEQRLAAALRRGLTAEGFVVEIATTGPDGLAAARTGGHDAVLLDVMLPQLSGYEVVRRLRREGNWVPVMLVTAKDGEHDEADGLDCGADDYLTKPFSLEELKARLRALLRRSAGQADPILRYGRIALDVAARSVTLDGQPVELSARELATLEQLLANAGRVLSRSQLEEKLYGWGDEVESNAVEVFIHRLRKKLYPELIQTVRGVGYLVPRENS